MIMTQVSEAYYLGWNGETSGLNATGPKEPQQHGRIVARFRIRWTGNILHCFLFSSFSPEDESSAAAFIIPPSIEIFSFWVANSNTQ